MTWQWYRSLSQVQQNIYLHAVSFLLTISSRMVDNNKQYIIQTKSNQTIITITRCQHPRWIIIIRPKSAIQQPLVILEIAQLFSDRIHDETEKSTGTWQSLQEHKQRSEDRKTKAAVVRALIGAPLRQKLGTTILCLLFLFTLCRVSAQSIGEVEKALCRSWCAARLLRRKLFTAFSFRPKCGVCKCRTNYVICYIRKKT